VVPAEAAAARTIFERYLELGSVRTLADDLDRRGIRSKPRQLSNGRLNRACMVVTDAEPERLAPLPPPAPVGPRGVWVVAARWCADTIERSFGMSKSKRARTTMARSASKGRSTAAGRKIAGHHPTRANSKQAWVLGLLSRPAR
jgi:hypothetical protein